MRESDALHARVRRFIEGASDESFDALARDLASFQARHIEPLARLPRGVALPTDVFRLRRVAAHPESEDERCFFTSGTTQALAGKHAMRTTATYRLAALTWARARLFPSLEVRLVALVPSEKQAPHSSLTFMLARFAEELGGASWHFDGERLDVDGIVRACRSGEPLLVAGTSFAFVHLLDALGDTTLPLARGSRVMHTGGFKGRSRSVEPSALRKSIAQLFDLAESSVIGEYGMTELSSQLYQGAGMGYDAPPWVQVSAVDPETLEPVAGEGLARIVDLANVDSAVAIQTSDIVRVMDDGAVELLGRAAGATPRGCSLALEHLL
jgi:hypothetical protein